MVLEVWCPVLGFFQLIWGVSSKLTLNVVNKSPRIPKNFLEEGFEFWLCDQSGTLVTALMLSLSKADSAIEEWGYKWGMIHLGGAWSFEIVFILLTKVIAIHIRFFWIGFQRSSFKQMFLRLCLFPVLNLDWLHKCLYEFREKVLGRENKRWNKSLRKSNSLVTAGIWSFY